MVPLEYNTYEILPSLPQIFKNVGTFLLFLPDPCPRAPKETQYCRARRFLCHICQCTQGFATPWGGVGWGSDDVPLDLITLLMLRHALGWGGVGQWWRSFGLDHVVDATPRIGVGWGGVGQWWRSFGLDHGVDATPRIGVGWGGAVMTFLWTWSRCWCYATHWGGVGWGSDDVPLDLITLLDSTIKSARKTFIYIYLYLFVSVNTYI